MSILPPPPPYSSFLPPPPPVSSSRPPLPPNSTHSPKEHQKPITPSSTALSNEYLELTNILGINSLHSNQFIVTKSKEIIYYISNNLVIEYSLKFKKQLNYYYSSNGNLISSISLSSDEKFLIIGEKNEQVLSSNDSNDFLSIIVYNLNYFHEKKQQNLNKNLDKKLILNYDKKNEKFNTFYYDKLYSYNDEKIFNEEYYDDFYDKVLHDMNYSSTEKNSVDSSPITPASTTSSLSFSMDLPPNQFYPNSPNVYFNEKTQHIGGISCLKLLKVYNKKLKKFHNILISIGFTNDKQLLIWDLDNKLMIKKFKINRKIYSISYNSSLNYFITCGDRHLKWWYLHEINSTDIDEKFIDHFTSFFDIEGKATAITEEYAESVFMDVICYNNDKERRKFNNINNNNLFSSYMATLSLSSSYNPSYDAFLYPSTNIFNCSPSSPSYPSHIHSYIFTINSYGVLFKISSERQIVNVVQLESLTFSYSLDLLYSTYFNNSLNILGDNKRKEPEYEDDDHFNCNYKRVEINKDTRNPNEDYLFIGGDNGKILLYSASNLAYLGHLPLPSPLNNNLNKKLIRDSKTYQLNSQKRRNKGIEDDKFENLDKFLNQDNNLTEDCYYPACYISLLMITPTKKLLSPTSFINFFDLKLISVYSNAQIISFNLNNVDRIKKNFSFSFHTNLVKNIEMSVPSSALSCFQHFYTYNDNYYSFLLKNEKIINELKNKKEDIFNSFNSPIATASSTTSFLSPLGTVNSSASTSLDYPSLFSLPPGTFITYSSDDTIKFWNLNIDQQIKNNFLQSLTSSSSLFPSSLIKFIKKSNDNSLLFSMNLNNFNQYSTFHMLEKDEDNDVDGVDDSFMSSASTATNLSFYNNEKNKSSKNFFNYSCDYPNLEENYKKNSSKFAVKFLIFHSFLNHLIVVDNSNVIKVYDLIYNFNLLHTISYKKEKKYASLSSLTSTQASEIISLNLSPTLYTHEKKNNWSFYTEKVNLLGPSILTGFKRLSLLVTSTRNGYLYLYDTFTAYTHLITINNNIVPLSPSSSDPVPPSPSPSYIDSVLFTHDGKKIVTVSSENIISFYQIDKSLSSTLITPSSSVSSNILYHSKNPSSLSLKLIKKLSIKDNKKIIQLKIDFLNKFLILLVNYNEILIYNINNYKLIRTYSFNFNDPDSKINSSSNQLINFELDPSGLFIILYNHSFNTRNKKILFIDFFDGKNVFFEVNFFNEIIMNFKLTFNYLYLTTCNGTIKLFKLKKKLKIMILERLHELLVNKVKEDEEDEKEREIESSIQDLEEQESSLNDYYKQFLSPDLINQLVHEYYQATLILNTSNKNNSKIFYDSYNENEIKILKHLIEIILKIHKKFVRNSSIDELIFPYIDKEESEQEKKEVENKIIIPQVISYNPTISVSKTSSVTSSISKSKWSIPTDSTLKFFGKEVRSSISNKKLTLEFTSAVLTPSGDLGLEDTEDEGSNEDNMSEEEKVDQKIKENDNISNDLDKSEEIVEKKRRGSHSNINIMTSTFSEYSKDKLFSFESSTEISPPTSPISSSSTSGLSSSKVINSTINNLEEWLEEVITNNEDDSNEFLAKNEKILSKLKEIKQINDESLEIEKKSNEINEYEDKINEKRRKFLELIQHNKEKDKSYTPLLNSSVDFNLTLSSVGKDEDLSVTSSYQPSTSNTTTVSQSKSAKQSKSTQKDKQCLSNPLYASDSKPSISTSSSLTSTSSPSEVEKIIENKTKELNQMIQSMTSMQSDFISNYNNLIAIRKENYRKQHDIIASSSNSPSNSLTFPPPPPPSTSLLNSPSSHGDIECNLEGFRKSFNHFNKINLLFLNSINNNDQFNYEAAAASPTQGEQSFRIDNDVDFISSFDFHDDSQTEERNKELNILLDKYSDQFLNIISDKLKKSVNFS